MASNDAGVATTVNVVQWFEIPAQDLNRAKAFYEAVLGLPLTPLEHGEYKMAWFPNHKGAAGSSGGLIQAPGRTPSKSGALVYLSVADLDAALAKVTQLGGTIAMPKTRGPEYGTLAHIVDCEGNLVALYEP